MLQLARGISGLNETQTQKSALVVEDDPSLQEMLCLILGDAGYTVAAAATGREALRKIAEGCPDLVTLDLVIPDIDGFGVIEDLRHQPNPPVVVIISGSVGLKQASVPLPSFVVGVVSKPFRVSDLVAICELALATGASTPEVERRRMPRRVLISAISVVSDTDAPVFVGTLTTLSPLGAELILEARLEPRAPIRFRLPVMGAPGPVSVAGTILYRRPVRGGFLYGIALNPDPTTDRHVRDFLGW